MSERYPYFHDLTPDPDNGAWRGKDISLPDLAAHESEESKGPGPLPDLAYSSEGLSGPGAAGPAVLPSLKVPQLPAGAQAPKLPDLGTVPGLDQPKATEAEAPGPVPAVCNKAPADTEMRYQWGETAKLLDTLRRQLEDLQWKVKGEFGGADCARQASQQRQKTIALLRGRISQLAGQDGSRITSSSLRGLGDDISILAKQVQELDASYAALVSSLLSIQEKNAAIASEAENKGLDEEHQGIVTEALEEVQLHIAQIMLEARLGKDIIESLSSVLGEVVKACDNTVSPTAGTNEALNTMRTMMAGAIGFNEQVGTSLERLIKHVQEELKTIKNSLGFSCARLAE